MEKKAALIRLSDLWRWDGTIDRLPYAIWGSGLVAVKFGLDTFVSSFFFHRSWSWLNYISPGQALDVLAMSAQDQAFYASMLAMSLPFVWVGIVLTMRRLRAAALPVWLCKLFFLPVVNLVVFASLCILPTQSDRHILQIDENKEEDVPKRELPGISGELSEKEQAQLAEIGLEEKNVIRKTGDAYLKRLPSPYTKEARYVDALYSLVMTVPAASVLAFFGASVLKTYGWSLFIGVPFAVGMAASYLYGRKHFRSLAACILVSTLALTLVGMTIFIWAWEGMICLLMAAPIAYALALMGALLGYNLQKKKNLPLHNTALLLSLLVILPLSMAADYADRSETPLCAVSSVCEIKAPPQKVWDYVIAFPSLPEPREAMFHMGIAYPTGAVIEGKGAGAVRRCKFSTGTFVEPITDWQPGRLLRFGVRSQPEPMKEYSLNHDLKPAHLNGYLNIKKGEFDLAEVKGADGTVSTRVTGTTWYENKMWPQSYWRFYADNIMHAIHMRVLNHIKKLSESDNGGA